MTLRRRTDDGSGIIDYELGQVYNEIGVAYAMNERYEEAELHFLSSMNVYQSLPDSEDVNLGWPMPNLGFIYWLNGQYAEAREVLLEILRIHESAYGENDTQSFKTGKIYYALGNVYTSMGDYEAGFEYHKRCLKQYQETLGDDNHRVADTFHRLADHCIRIMDYDKANHYISRALETFGNRSYYRNEYARSSYKEAEILKALGLNEEADT
ncbi:MAG: hypothetical protein M1823_007089, partial [Watsoniomyces obsoletus]